jgi:hypothetical protein
MSPSALEAARLDLGLSVLEVWLAYFVLGGLRTAAELNLYLLGIGSSTDADHDTLVHALNEAYNERGQRNHLAYRHP